MEKYEQHIDFYQQSCEYCMILNNDHLEIKNLQYSLLVGGPRKIKHNVWLLSDGW